MKRICEAVRRWLERYVPGMLMALALAFAFCVIYVCANFLDLLEAENAATRERAEYVLKRTGLGACASAANTVLGYSDYFRDGDSLYVFEVRYGDEREAVFREILRKENWREVQVTADEYAAWAENFFSPASLVRPMDDVVFDAFYFRDCFPGDAGDAYFSAWSWDHLPESLKMEDMPYTTDFDAAFYDKESGVFFYYDQRM